MKKPAFSLVLLLFASFLANAAPVILTPPAPDTPRINGAKIFGVRPGSPFLFTIPATGERPMEFSVEGAPAGLIIITNGQPANIDTFIGVLTLDPATGQLTGSITAKGEYKIVLVAKNSKGEARKNFRIVCGDTIALTPPMGWNSWNCFAGAVDDAKVRSAAAAMVASGLINHGWTYINIDDTWEGSRDANGNIQSNGKFPDMKALADYVHSKGLKIGIYSSPGPKTCAGFEASWRHELQDAQQYAAWGFDYLKYDWCTYGDIAAGKEPDAKGIPPWNGSASDPSGAIYPYQVMGKFLREQNRDIVFSLCQYGMADVEKWGGSVGGNCWRTTDDITDKWGEARHGWQGGGGGAGGGVATIGFNQNKVAPFAKPGNWNDPDMLVVGEVGWGHLHPTRLTPDEQYTHISLWCLLSAPLLIGCDMEKFDDFTLNLLSNDEVLAVDQDSLGREATCVSVEGSLRVFAKDLDDGSKAVGLFNLGDTPAMVVARWENLKLSGAQTVRDLWRQKDLGGFNKEFSTTVAPHGVVLVKIQPAKIR